MNKLLLVLFSISLFISCDSKLDQDVNNEIDSKKNPHDNSFVISKTWMRPGIVNRNTAAFMTIFNNTAEDDTLFSVQSGLAKVVELHETYEIENDMMGMRHVDYISIPKNSSVELKPGSFHVMLIGLINDIAIGEKHNVTLGFKNQGEIKLELLVKQ